MMDDTPIPPAYSAPPLPVASYAGGSSMPTERAEQSGPMMDWERKWAECHDTITANDSAVEISVVDPEVHGTNMVTKYVAYTVKTEPYMYSVCRRYSDFLWLRDQLVQGYPGLLIPALPPKKTTTGVHRDVEGDFVRARMNALDIFMKMLTKIPFLIADPALEAFCSKSAGPEWDSAKSRIDAGSDVQPNIGCQEWRKLLDGCGAPEDDLTIERISMEVKTHLGVLISNLDAMDRDWMSASSMSEKFSKTMEVMAAGVTQWRDFELSIADPDTQNVINALGDVMTRGVSVTNDVFEQWSLDSLALKESVSKELLCCIQTQDMLAKGMHELLCSREVVAKEITKVESELNGLRTDLERLKQRRESLFDQMAGKTPAKVEGSIVKRENNLAFLKSTLARIGCALWFSEVDRFGRERALKLDDATKTIVELNVQRASQTLDRWRQLAETVNV